MGEHAGGLSGIVGLRKSVCFYAHPTSTNILRTVNVGVLGIVGYLAYTNWKRPSWDRRVVSATSAGLIALWGTEMSVFTFLRYLNILMSHYSVLSSGVNVRQYFRPKS